MNWMDDAPRGFYMALAKDLDAFKAFARLTDDQQRQVLEAARHITVRRPTEQRPYAGFCSVFLRAHPT